MRATPLPMLLVSCAAVGLVVGSFLNVVVHRVPAGLSVSRPRSACPGCGTAIHARDNIPVLSWLILRGACRSCGAPISARYPALELLTAALFTGAGLRFGWSLTLPAVAVFFAGLVALAAVDIERFLLPRKIVYATGLLTCAFLLAAAATGGEWRRLAAASACGAGAFALFRVMHLANPRWLGYGDVRLSAVIGMALGWLGLPYLLLGFLVANLSGIVVQGALIASGRANRRSRMPYGAFLALGSVVAVFAGGAFRHLLLPGS